MQQRRLVAGERGLEEDKVALLQGRGERRIDLREGARLGPLEEGGGGEAAEEQVAGYQVAEQLFAVRG